MAKSSIRKDACHDCYVLIKLWFHISNAEQLRRFQERGKDPLKQWKITDEDWRNRSKWEQYEKAVEDMLDKTSTQETPWYIIEGEDKHYARVKTNQTVIDAIKERLNRQSP